MRAQFEAFPVVYFNAECKRHQALLEVRIEPAHLPGNDKLIGGQIISTSCRVGGAMPSASCVDDWVVTVNAGGNIAIVK